MKKIIYDFGACRGENIDYYLLKSNLVVAFEANPNNCKYIQEKFRQAGHKTMCLPFLRWVHRFGRPDGVKYPLTMENKLRNFFIGHYELGLDIAPIIEHFEEWKTKEQLLQMAAIAKKEMIDLGYFK